VYFERLKKEFWQKIENSAIYPGVLKKSPKTTNKEKSHQTPSTYSLK